jgi:hypothetical protein
MSTLIKLLKDKVEIFKTAKEKVLITDNDPHKDS